MSRTWKQRGRSMRDILGGALVVAVALSAATAMALDPKEKDPKKIFQAMEDRDMGDRGVAHVTMTLVDSSGRKRERGLMSWRLKFKGGTKQLMIFESPADVRNTGLLSVDYDDAGKEDDQWLYLPALHRSTRISGADRSGSFLGTDISYADLTKRDVDAYEHKLLEASVKVDGEDCWLVESRPKTDKEKNETGYLKTQFWISKSKLMPMQIKSWVEKGQKLKYLKFTDYKNHEGVWIAHTTSVRTMKNDKVESTTIMKFTSVKFNDTSVDEADFTQRRLEQGL
jgi:outer membrane lipoprotein-sorting protein